MLPFLSFQRLRPQIAAAVPSPKRPSIPGSGTSVPPEVEEEPPLDEPPEVELVDVVLPPEVEVVEPPLEVEVEPPPEVEVEPPEVDEEPPPEVVEELPPEVDEDEPPFLESPPFFDPFFESPPLLLLDDP